MTDDSSTKLKTTPWMLVVLLVLLLFGLWYVGFGLTVLGIATAVLVVLSVFYVMEPQLLKDAGLVVVVYVAFPMGIVLLFTFSWWLALAAVPLYIIFVVKSLQQMPVAGGIALILLLTLFVVLRPANLFTPDSPLGKAFAAQELAVAQLWNWVTDAPNTVIKQVETQWARATGSYYESTIQETKGIPLGVALEVKSVESRSKDVPFWVYARLKGAVLDDPVSIDFSCSVNTLQPSRYAPDNHLVVFSRPKYEYDTEAKCFYDRGTFTTGQKTVTVKAVYAFKTLSSLEGWFIDAERLTALTTAGRTPADEGVVDYPDGEQTPGPVKVGLGFSAKQPFEIDRSQSDLLFTVGVTLDRFPTWTGGGRILNVRNLFITFPKEIELQTIDLAKYVRIVNFTTSSCDQLPDDDRRGCVPDQVNVYRTEFIVGTEDPLFSQYPLTLNLLASVKRDRYDALLGPGGKSSRLFRATVDYVYEIEHKQVFQVT